MKLYNTKTLQVEEFVPRHPHEVNMYVCGPTVYNYVHIGNARPIVIFDTLRRVFEAEGYNVRYVSNYTDVDDKIINKAIEEGVSETEIAERYMAAYNKIREDLHTEPLYDAPQVTKTMNEIIAFIGELVDKGYAYVVDGDVYFSVDMVPGYGHLSHQNPKDLEVGARVAENDKKRSGLDFALWKKTDKGIKWDSPWGPGRPGWHTECVVMIDKDFNHESIDIHGGGKDLRFPHHENENAQNLAAKGKDLANYWIHNGMVNVSGQKMSKSLGNTVWAKDVIEELGPDLTRWILLSVRYRDVLDYSPKTIEEAEKGLRKITTPIHQANVKLALADKENLETYDKASYGEFLDAMNDDLNTPNAYAVMYKTAGALNQALRVREPDLEKIAEYRNALEKMLDILGIPAEKLSLSAEEKDLYRAWLDARKEKDFEKADKLRSQLEEKGIL
ncbi:MAG: cysteine--tRNA ligase [Erysipelotrichales bacterium]|nr:cysteine--tRNA ligase [Erysipelotrichales bacterium]MBQ2309843.1 cysteine--tRNA ligase [Erysipelotrichales bacterium]MBQ4375027.1 cysteine--tRNA ligase [Erysipelotrichales bacterium]MBQ5542987.1 cysteine--tRNA ligase [Erysipelotrichales bacterium]